MESSEISINAREIAHAYQIINHKIRLGFQTLQDKITYAYSMFQVYLYNAPGGALALVVRATAKALVSEREN